MTQEPETGKIPVGISSCLLGERVRYDGGHKQDAFITGTLDKIFVFRSFCPEIDIGLGVPRAPIRLVSDSGTTRCVGTQDTQLDVTDRLLHSADEQQSWQGKICGYIFKQGSPSCGVAEIRVFRDGQPVGSAAGIYAGRVMHNFPDLPVAEEGRLGDPASRENFIERVFVYRRWQQYVAAGPDWTDVATFHARHKYLLMSHDPERTRELGRWLAAAVAVDRDTLYRGYRSRLMTILAVVPTREKHVNVLQHIQGYLKDRLDTADRQELAETIGQYRGGLLPLRVPITLLRHHFRRHPDDYIAQSCYVYPPPQDQALLNRL
jgi:uncharacterized protein YbgA (DUF1722 family)/uncharacterized protein YbbK (DUF523 family)